MIARASSLDVKEVIMSMAHRGRFNILCNLLDFPVHEFFRKVKGYNNLPDEIYNATCDVVHHIANSNKKTFPGAGSKE
jgi:2-oxoglutarate dehydrogenase complex dehydrogenase (E1) component-like enzyme